MHIWLISPYHTGSHLAWAEDYARHSRHRVTLLTMAGRFWKWRMQGGAIELAAQAERLLGETCSPDAILINDMLNLPAWLGLLRGRLSASIPIALYMHENQLTYPWRPGEGRDLTYAMINWLSQLAADGVVFNSRYHHDVWFDELPRLLKHYPDYNHLSLIRQVRARSGVIPVGIRTQEIIAARQEDPVSSRPCHGDRRFAPPAADGAPPLVLWNQRWEHDKRPDRFFDLLYRLRDEGLCFRLAVAGENFRRIPVEFEKARNEFSDVISHWGYADSRAAYIRLLGQADLVISTAEHEFFGISVLEAIMAGACALLPDRLSYPELIPPAFHDRVLYTDDEDLFRKARAYLADPTPLPAEVWNSVVARFDWAPIAAQYDDFLQRLVDRRLPLFAEATV